MQQLTLEMSGSALKRAGQALALDHAGNAWVAETLTALRQFCANLKADGKSEFTMEEFRATRGHALPASHKAWGSVPGIAARLGIIKWTGRYRKAMSPKTHSHEVKIWKVL